MRIINTGEITENSALSHNEREWAYNGLDCCVTLEVLNALLPQLDNTTTPTYSFSRSLQAPILEMTMRGVLIDQERRHEVLTDYRKQIKQLDEQVSEIVHDGVGFTPALAPTGKAKESRWWRSPAQLKNLFYDVMGIPVIRKRNTQTGLMQPTVNREAMEKISDYFLAEPITNHILALRDIDKKRGFLETGIDPDGRMRANFNIAGTNTGRLACSMSDFGTGNNLQNVDRELRSTFISDPGWKFANLDLEQGDARNVGAICWNLFVESHGEQFAGAYLDACESGDLHTTVCRMAWKNLAWTDDPKANKLIAEAIAYRQDSYRQLAKKLGHGTNYYGTPPTMAKHTKVDKGMIEQFQHNYFRAFPVIGSAIGLDRKRDLTAKNWHNHVRQELKDWGHITSLFGRKRHFFGRADDDSTLREAIAYEPQSMTADEIDTGIIKLWRADRVQLLIQVHDSILLQYREEDEAEIIPWALEALKAPLVLERDRKFTVPTEAKVGWNWGDFSEKNPDGLMKWKGGDDRKRSRTPGKLSAAKFFT